MRPRRRRDVSLAPKLLVHRGAGGTFFPPPPPDGTARPSLPLSLPLLLLLLSPPLAPAPLLAGMNRVEPKDTEVVSPPPDSVSCLKFSPTSNMLVAGSWDNQIRLWDVQTNGQSVGKAAIQHDGPILCCGWSGDGARVFSGGADNVVKMWDLASNNSSVIARHDAPVKTVHWINDMNLLLTGSWDRSLRYWDGNSANAAHTIQVPERVYAADVSFPLLVVATAERHICIYDLRNPGKEYKRIVSPLKYQSRCLSLFPNREGFAVGSIEGRVAIHHVESHNSSKDFAFKCHRVDRTASSRSNGPQDYAVYSVNAINFHQAWGTFATAGSDGSFSIWDKNERQRLKGFPATGVPITAADFNNQGSIYAYAHSYDWSQGHEAYTGDMRRTAIMLHSVREDEVKPKPKAGKKR